MDPKWRLVAADSGQPVHAVLAVWAAMLCHASGIEPHGPPPERPPPDAPPSLETDFADWYGRYPHRVGRAAAERAYRAARQRGATREALLAGAARYRERLAQPEAPRPCNPATWLAQDRWLDEPMPLETPSRIKACGRSPAPEPTPSPPPSLLTAHRPSRAAIAGILAQRCPRLHPARVQDFAQQLDLWFSRGRIGWNSFWGDPPDSPECEIPAAAIDAVRAHLAEGVEGRA